MSRKRPPVREIERSSDNPKRGLRASPSAHERANLSRRATYAPYSKHKAHPHAYGLPAYQGGSPDRVLCDDHADFQPADVPRIGGLLTLGIMAGLWGENDSQGDPSIIWTVDVNGWIYEARITIPGQANYHAYPLLPSDALARLVIVRFEEWISNLAPNELLSYPNALASMQAAQEKYK